MRSVNYAKRSSYWAANGRSGKIGRIASKEVTVKLLLQRRMPILFCGFEVCALDESPYNLYRFHCEPFMKLFGTCVTAN